jgi:hypothetical protein
MWKLALILGLAASPALADITGPGGKVIECYCTDTQGSRVELGQEICLFVNGRAFMALCEMALNVPIWRDTGIGCLSSSLDENILQFSKPTLQSFAVYTPI